MIKVCSAHLLSVLSLNTLVPAIELTAVSCATTLGV